MRGRAERENPDPGWIRHSLARRGAERDLVTMAGPQPLALQLEQLLNPRPREADPEADPEEGEADWGKATCGAVVLARCGSGRCVRGRQLGLAAWPTLLVFV